MKEHPTPEQAVLLFALLARHGECRQAELTPKLKPADRDRLVEAGLVERRKRGRATTLSLSDDGWAWAGDHLGTALPPAHGTLQALLARLDTHLAATGASLADFIGLPPKPEDIAAARPPRKPRRPTPAALRKRIEQAYLVLTDGRRDRSVRLAHLRRELDDLDRATLDAGLARILKGDAKAALMRHDDPRQINRADREAAFDPAGEPFHLLWIAS